jgi:hypothetical protein
MVHTTPAACGACICRMNTDEAFLSQLNIDSPVRARAAVPTPKDTRRRDMGAS